MFVNFTRLFQCVVILVSWFSIPCISLFNNAIDSPFSSPFQPAFTSGLGIAPRIGLKQPTGSFGPFDGYLKRRCPVCDSSVYGYCSEKLFHDSCCCYVPNNPYDQLPYQCKFADCSFLHANSCKEHELITACCCTNFLVYRK